MRSKKGFTLIELIVVLAVIAILAAILTPVIGRYIDDARRSTATKDAQQFAAAINMFFKDVGSYPGWKSSLTTDLGSAFTFLISTTNADTPKSTTHSADWSITGLTLNTDYDTMNDHLESNTILYRTTGRFRWRGPYHQDFKEDPWGNYYVYNSKNITPSNISSSSAKALIVISAGPDEDIDTDGDVASTSFAPSDDDIAVQIR